MTTTALTTTGLPRARTPGIPMTRLVRVELRKLVDTRAGFWLLAGLALLTAAAIGIYLVAADPSDLTFARFVSATVLPQSTLLPVLGIMAVTGEWTQRTGLVTHTLEPRRGRVLAAKYAATGILGLLVIALGLAVAAGGNLLGSALVHGNGSWAYGLEGLRDTLLFQFLSLLQGLALGTLLMNTAAAVVLYFGLPTAFLFLVSTVHALRDAAPWVDVNTAQQPLLEHTLSGAGWLHLLTTTALWILLPLTAGLWRLLRREIT